jgi:hypothetical protein
MKESAMGGAYNTHKGDQMSNYMYYILVDFQYIILKERGQHIKMKMKR